MFINRKELTSLRPNADLKLNPSDFLTREFHEEAGKTIGRAGSYEESGFTPEWQAYCAREFLVSAMAHTQLWCDFLTLQRMSFNSLSFQGNITEWIDDVAFASDYLQITDSRKASELVKRFTYSDEFQSLKSDRLVADYFREAEARLNLSAELVAIAYGYLWFRRGALYKYSIGDSSLSSYHLREAANRVGSSGEVQSARFPDIRWGRMLSEYIENNLIPRDDEDIVGLIKGLRNYQQSEEGIQAYHRAEKRIVHPTGSDISKSPQAIIDEELFIAAVNSKFLPAVYKKDSSVKKRTELLGALIETSAGTFMATFLHGQGLSMPAAVALAFVCGMIGRKIPYFARKSEAYKRAEFQLSSQITSPDYEHHFDIFEPVGIDYESDQSVS